MARNTRWDNPNMVHDNNSMRFTRYENEQPIRNINNSYDRYEYDQEPSQHIPDRRYNRFNQEMPRSIQEYPVPLTLPVPLSVPASLEYEPMVDEHIKSELILEDDWSNGLCDCCSDWGGCCFAFWCLPCFLCSFDKDSKECCCTSVGLCCFNPTGVCNAVMLQRAKMRGAYQINGSIFEDFCLTYFCCFCVLLQLHNEMRYRGDAM